MLPYFSTRLRELCRMATKASLLGIALITIVGVSPAAQCQTFSSLYSFSRSINGKSPVASLVQGLDGNFYGTASVGGVYGYGTVFQLTPDGTVTILHSFNKREGTNPNGLMQASDGNLFGTTYGAGQYNFGTVFKITTGGTFTNLYNFTDGADGAFPNAALVQAKDGNLYGTTSGDSVHNFGTVFKITKMGAFTRIVGFKNGADGGSPNAALVQATDGNLYGTTTNGGANNDGVVFKVTAGGVLTTLHSFNKSDGAFPAAGLIQGRDGHLYGTTYQGGTNDSGTVFQITTDGIFKSLHNFSNSEGAYPSASLLQANDGNLYGTTAGGGARNLGVVFKLTTEGTLTTLHSFNSPEGSVPQGSLIQATDGDLYGTTPYGRANGSVNGYGTVFKITPQGVLTTLHYFGNDGVHPNTPLVAASDGNLYGTTSIGKEQSVGTVFRVTTNGALTYLHSFDNEEGISVSALIQAHDGNLYGTTTYGGVNGYGTVFQITTDGTLTTLHSFNKSDGANPQTSLVQASDGNLYGTTSSGGVNNDGVVYKISTGGAFTTLYSFSGLSGPRYSALIQANDGNLYCTAADQDSHGFVFKITTSGTLTTLYTFSEYSDSTTPTAALLQGSDGNLYGSSSKGGAYARGIIYRITTGGMFTVLHSFNSSDGYGPYSALIQLSNGDLYGTAIGGGTQGNGVLFKISMSGAFTPLHMFTGPDGAAPNGPVQASDGNLYGTTAEGGALGNYSSGTVYKVALAILDTITPGQVAVGSADTMVTLTGTNFVPQSTVTWGPGTLVSLKTTYVSGTQLKAVIPASVLVKAGSFVMYVTNPTAKGGNSNLVHFTVNNPVPTLTSFTPNSIVEGSPNTTLTINGSHFIAGSAVRFRTTALTTTFVSSTQLTAVVPASLLLVPGNANVTVTNTSPGGGTSTPLTFTISAGPTTVALVASPAPSIAHTSTSLVVTASLENTGNYDARNIQITACQLNKTGSTQIVPSGIFKVSRSGQMQLKLTFPLSSAAVGSTPTLSVTYTSLNAGSGTLRVTCGKVP